MANWNPFTSYAPFQLPNQQFKALTRTQIIDCNHSKPASRPHLF